MCLGSCANNLDANVGPLDMVWQLTWFSKILLDPASTRTCLYHSWSTVCVCSAWLEGAQLKSLLSCVYAPFPYLCCKFHQLPWNGYHPSCWGNTLLLGCLYLNKHVFQVCFLAKVWRDRNVARSSLALMWSWDSLGDHWPLVFWLFQHTHQPINHLWMWQTNWTVSVIIEMIHHSRSV